MEGFVVKRLRAVVAACALAACMMVFLAGCSGSSANPPETKDPTVSSPVIGEDGTLRVGVNTDNSPLAGMSTNNDKIIGVDVDIAAAIADELGLKLSIVDVGSDPEGALSDGKVDIVMGIDSSNASSDLWLSDEYLPTGVALFALSSENAGVPTADSTPSVAAQISSKSAWAVTNSFGDSALKSTSNLADGFSQLEAGSVDYVAADAIIGLYAARHEGIDASIVALMADASGYCVGVATTNADLQNTVNETLRTLIDNGTINVIEMKWLGQSLDLSALPKIEATAANEEPAAEESADGTADDATADTVAAAEANDAAADAEGEEAA